MISELPDLTEGVNLLRTWRSRARTNQRAHYLRADNLIRRARIWSASAAILSASIGVLILVTARLDTPTWVHFITGALSIVAAAIATINASQKPSEIAAQHHAGGAAYGVILRQIEEALALPPRTEAEMKLLTKELREKLDAIPMTVPIIPNNIWPQVQKALTASSGEAVQPIIPPDAAR